MQATVPLAPGDCADYRASLKADFSDPGRIRFAGSYPNGCGERVWPVAYADPKSYAVRAVEGVWKDMGGKLSGQVREGRVPAGLKPAFEMPSPALAELVRDINKYSNNVMAQQLFLTLSLPPRSAGGGPQAGVATLAGSREVLRNWWRDRFGDDRGLPILRQRLRPAARSERISATGAGVACCRPRMRSAADARAHVLAADQRRDGTLRAHAAARGTGSAHLKTGSLRDCDRRGRLCALRPAAAAMWWWRSPTTPTPPACAAGHRCAGRMDSQADN